MAILVLLMFLALAQSLLLNNRPPVNERKFNSTAVERIIVEFSTKFKDPLIAQIFENCFPSTLDTTVERFVANGDNSDTFIITGDIPAMWFRDSTNQVAPYLHFIQEDANLKLLFKGLINRQIDSVLHDPYANAYNQGEDGGPWQGDKRVPEMTPRVFEGKYELDSLAAILKLSNQYYQYSNQDTSVFNDKWISGVDFIVKTIRDQQADTGEEYVSPAYKFNRLTEVATDTLMMQGRGVPSKRCGLSKCAFRPSDDATTFPFLIPANAMAVVELEKVSEILDVLQNQNYENKEKSSRIKVLSEEARQLASEIRKGIDDYAFAPHPIYGTIFAYEVDGFGSAYFMDDANIPSLLSLPYLGFTSKDDPIYLQTREFVLSSSNPFYFSGSVAKGVGGPHIGYGYIWPMALCIQALTSNSDQEIIDLLETLKTTTGGTNFMHESFWKDDSSNFTRSWFAWANSLFAELILHLSKEKPHLIFKQ